MARRLTKTGRCQHCSGCRIKKREWPWNVTAGEGEGELGFQVSLPVRKWSPPTWDAIQSREKGWNILTPPSFQPPANISHWPNLTKVSGQWLPGKCHLWSLISGIESREGKTGSGSEWNQANGWHKEQKRGIKCQRKTNIVYQHIYVKSRKLVQMKFVPSKE